MMRIVVFVLAFVMLHIAATAQQTPLLLKHRAETESELFRQPAAAPLRLPDVMPLREARRNASGTAMQQRLSRVLDGDVIAATEARQLLFEGETMVFRIDPTAKTVERVDEAPQLSSAAEQALEQSPEWLRDRLRLKLRLLAERNQDDDFARLITGADPRIKDEIAFTIAGSSVQTLTETRFGMDREMLVRNAEHIYTMADSLQYVRLVEHGSYENRDYFTTTEYRIYDSAAQDTIWSEIPRDYYYWYVVHPKMDQEGVYVVDNTSSSGQRTYGYSWREFIWANPDPTHDYQPVNITTNKGTVASIRRFGELMKHPRLLWSREATYLPFNRDYAPGQSALDMLGNWASRAVPVDVTLPRAFQPNQILIKHNGNCNEDAFLVAAACRTALIPIVYLGCHAEDHVFGCVWDDGWHHYEFFRGGLSERGNQFFGITNMLPGGSYGWDISMVEATRPDGYPFNMTAGYADTCTFTLTVTDTLGNPMEGTMVQVYGPNVHGQGYRPCMHFYTNSSGIVTFAAGADKRYLVNLFHPHFGWSPPDSTRAYYLTQRNTTAGASYNVTVPYPHLRRSDDAPTVDPPSVPRPWSVKVTSGGSQIVSGVNTRDSQRSRFHRWEAQGGGMLAAMLLDADNFDAWKRSAPYSCLAYTPSLEAGAWGSAVANDRECYLVLKNRAPANILEQADVRVELYDGVVASAASPPAAERFTVEIAPHPVSTFCAFRSSAWIDRIEIIDVLGHRIAELQAPWQWRPASTVHDGMYFARIHSAGRVQMRKLILVR